MSLSATLLTDFPLILLCTKILLPTFGQYEAPISFIDSNFRIMSIIFGVLVACTNISNNLLSPRRLTVFQTKPQTYSLCKLLRSTLAIPVQNLWDLW